MSNKTSAKIVVLPGDGIGPEVCDAALPVIRKAAELGNLELSIESCPVGGTSYDLHGTPLTEETLKKAQQADAVVLGAVGGPKWEALDYSVRPERALLALRKELGLFANLRPAVCFAPLVDASPLKPELVADLDIMVVRELTGGIYFGQPRGVRGEGRERTGFNTLVYSVEEIERIGRVAFETARKRNNNVVSVDKANVLESTELWREVISDLHRSEYSDVTLSHMYVDNAAMQLVRAPKQFDVIVTTNMFGDILSDIASQLTGSIGMLASASLGSSSAGMYEPVHGSAPDIAGKGIANPLATILSGAMMLRLSLDCAVGADAIERAVQQVLADGVRTGDIGGKETTAGMANAVLAALEAALV